MRKVYNTKVRQTNNEKIKGTQEKQIQCRREKKTTKTLYSPECLNMPKGYDILVGRSSIVPYSLGSGRRDILASLLVEKKK